MTINDMNQRITFQNFNISVDEIGVETQAWSDYKTVWAAVSNLFGREYYAAAAVHAEKTVKFTIRYLTGLTEDMRILFKGKQYSIVFIDNIKYGNTFMEIKAVEVE